MLELQSESIEIIREAVATARRDEEKSRAKERVFSFRAMEKKKQEGYF